MAVFKMYGTKWHLSPKNNNPACPIVKKEVDKYHLTVKKIDVTYCDSGGGRIIVSIKYYASLW